MDPERELYFEEGIRYLPRILEIVDRNRLSPTYGCFDRSFWHYRTSDFPSGMYQECVLPLALVYLLDHPKNPYYQVPRIKELVEAGINFARRSSQGDGSCDDYFPFERASGATAFSLYAATEAGLLLKIDSPEFIEFCKKRGRYLARQGFNESGVLSNHKALIVLALYNVFLLTGDPQFKKAAEEGKEGLLALQKGEGWFPEYEGCDPGYLTFTVDFLAKYWTKSKDESVREPLRRAVEFAGHFMHPDGSYGGEYGSRNTFHFLPHGFELAGRFVSRASGLADAFLKSLKTATRSSIDDDRIFCHYVYNFFQAYQDYGPRFKGGDDAGPPSDETKFFKEAGLLVRRSGEDQAVISFAKGGAMKVFKGGRMVCSDSGLLGVTCSKKKFTTQVVGDFRHEIEKDRIVVEGHFYFYEDLVFSPFKFILFRVFLLTLGRLLPANWVRRLIQKKAILKKKKFPLRFRKEIDFPTLRTVTYRLFPERSLPRIQALWVATDATFIYVATSQPYQKGCLAPWVDISSVLSSLNRGEPGIFQHSLS